MIIDTNYDYQEWYLQDLNATQTAQENRLSQRSTAPEDNSAPEKAARTDVVDFGADARNAVDSRLANGVAGVGEAEQNDAAGAATTQDNQLAKGTMSAGQNDGADTAGKKPELKLKLHTARLDKLEMSGSAAKPG